MEIEEILHSLETSWSRNDVLLRIKRGLGSEKIVNEFLKDNKKDIEELAKFFSENNKDILVELEELSACETKLIKKINNLSNHQYQNNFKSKKTKKFSLSKKLNSYNLGLFLMKWSNKFVVSSLLLISAIALSKQAWS